jgi:subtilisin-like proprotein convertase family protein
MAINPTTYANLGTLAVPHGVGYAWCTMLWDMTWEIIQTAGITPNIFDPTATGGNVIALKLVQEGLRLQPCGPGFVTGRNAILRADTLFYGGQYSCAIIKAFARRGLGVGASQGSVASITDGTPSFLTGGSDLSLTANVTQQLELNDIIYSQNVTALCEPISNYTLTDTLPAHVTWVSGGTYNPANRVVSFNPITLAANVTQAYQFTVNINSGSYFAPIEHLNDPVGGPAPGLPIQWTRTTTNTTANWVVSGTQSHTPLYSYFVNNIAVSSDVRLITANQYLLPAGPSVGNTLSFWHSYDSEAGFDGGVVEISTNGGTTWVDLGARMFVGGYNSSITGSPLGTRSAFTGNSGGFIQTLVDLSPYSGQSIMIRFRFGSDASVGGTGWFVDDILLNSIPIVFTKSNLFNASNVLQNQSTNRVEIIAACAAPVITTQPQNLSLCNSNNAVFSVVATGSGLTYQWELSTDGGATWNPITGATSNIYGIAAATSALNGRLYRVVINTACGNATSNPASIYVSPAMTHSGVTANPTSVCQPAPSVISGTANGGSVGGSFGNYTHTLTGLGTIVQNPPSGPNNQNASFTVTNAPVGVNNYVFTSRDGLGCTVSTTVTLTTSAPPVITVQPISRVICQGTSTTFGVTATGLNLTYQWQLSTNVGATWSNITGATANTIAITNAALSQSGHQYRVIVTTACGSVTSNSETLTVTPNPIHQNLSATPNPVCQPGPVALTGTAVGGTLTGGDVVLVSSGTINLAIVNNSTVTNSVTMPAFTFNSAANMKVRLNVSHSWVGDVTVSLTSPCGTTFLFNRPGVPATTLGNSNNLGTNNTTTPPPATYIFDIGAAAVIPETALASGFIPADSYRPSDIPGAPHSWAGITFPCTAAGTWTISITDAVAGDAGNLVEWAILGPSAIGVYSHSLTGPGTIVQNPSTGGPSNPTANFTASNLPAGTLTYNLTTTDSRGCSVTSPINVTVNPSPSTAILPLVTTVFNSTGGPINIPASGNGVPYPSTITTSGLPANARVLSVTLNGVTHQFPSDIDIMLQSPNGTNVILMSDVGGAVDITNANYTFQDGFPTMGTGLNAS